MGPSIEERHEAALLLIDTQKKRIAELEAELAEAKANHANLVEKNAVLRQRPDLPVDRIPAYETMVKERDQLREQYLDLKDRLDNGIKYDEELNVYTVRWTAREIEQAKNEADEICKVLGIGEKALKEVEG